MPSGETILKLTDFPFAYSIIGIISGVMGFSIGENQILFLGIAGAFGTFLTIIDPIGWIIRKNVENRIHRTHDKTGKLSNVFEKEYKISALKTKSINFEIEKIIGLFYFVIIISFFILAMATPTMFFEKLIIYDNNKEPLCSDFCFKFIYLTIGAITLFILAIKSNQFWRELDEKIEIAGFHQIAINNDNATQTSVESMTRAVEQNDWPIARLWYDKIQEEIKYKKGKRELIIKSADLVYSPLHKEATDFENQLIITPPPRRYPTFAQTEWNKIKIFSYQSIIEDSNLRHRITSFYNQINDYNKQIGTTNREIQKIINNHVSNELGGGVTRVRYDVNYDNANSEVDLIGCVLSDEHPLDSYGEKSKMSMIEITRNRNSQRTATAEDGKKFDNAWSNIISEAKLNQEVQKLQRIYAALKIENSKLLKIYSNKIGMQWKV